MPEGDGLTLTPEGNSPELTFYSPHGGCAMPCGFRYAVEALQLREKPLLDPLNARL
jgi:hypothetical protein